MLNKFRFSLAGAVARLPWPALAWPRRPVSAVRPSRRR
jgi:hypothetical protein